MYIVVSKWECVPGNEAKFEEIGAKMRAELRTWPGIVMTQGFAVPGGAIAIVGYESEAAYQSLIQSPDGPFEKLSAKHGVDGVGQWAWSERGESHDA